MNAIAKVIWGLLKFYYVYIGFGVFAVIILYASADLRLVMETGGQSFLQAVILTPERVSESDAAAAISDYFRVAFESVPAKTFLSSVLNISYDSNIVSEIYTLIHDLVADGNSEAALVRELRSYDIFWRDMAVAGLASMVLYAVMHLKKLIAGKGISVILGFAMASVFWIFASFTFGETVTYILERTVKTSNTQALYIIILLAAIVLEASIHGFGGKCSALKLAATLCMKVVFILLRIFFGWYMCALISSLFSAQNFPSASGLIGIISGIVISSGVFVCTSFAEDEMNNWAEKILP